MGSVPLSKGRGWVSKQEEGPGKHLGFEMTGWIMDTGAEWGASEQRVAQRGDPWEDSRGRA